MLPAATLSVQAHVEYLIEKGLVASDLPLTPDRVAFADLSLLRPCSTAARVDVGNRGFKAGRDLLQDRTHPLGIAAEVVWPVARRRPDVDARRLIFIEHANDDVVDEPKTSE